MIYNVTDVVVMRGHDEANILRLTASLERGSEHPLGEAIVKGAAARKLTLEDAEAFVAIPGHGVSGKIEKHNVLFGNAKLMRDRGVCCRRTGSVSPVKARRQCMSPSMKRPAAWWRSPTQ